MGVNSMELVILPLFLGFIIFDMYLTSKMQKQLDETTKKYNDLRVQYASLKSKRGVKENENN